MGRGLFIDFDGVDGSGTSSQVYWLLQKIEELDKYQDILKTHEPWKSTEIKRKLAEDKELYSDVNEMSRLFVEDRIIHCHRLISPTVEAGTIVVNSRYHLSTYAFQQAQGAPLDKLISMHKNVGIILPDITFFLDVSWETASKRIEKRGAKKEKFEQEEFAKKVIENYRDLVELAQKDKKTFGYVVRIDGEKSLEEVAEEVYQKFLPEYRIWKGLDVYLTHYFFKHSNLNS